MHCRTDLCLSNAIVKTGIGFGSGVLLSVIIFRSNSMIQIAVDVFLRLCRLTGRTWPVWLFTGVGMGRAYTECDMTFNPTAVRSNRLLFEA